MPKVFIDNVEYVPVSASTPSVGIFLDDAPVGMTPQSFNWVNEGFVRPDHDGFYTTIAGDAGVKADGSPETVIVEAIGFRNSDGASVKVTSAPVRVTP